MVISYTPFQTAVVCFCVEYSCATEYKFLIAPEALTPLCSLSSSWTTQKRPIGSYEGRRSNYSSIYTDLIFRVLLWTKKSKSLGFIIKTLFVLIGNPVWVWHENNQVKNLLPLRTQFVGFVWFGLGFLSILLNNPKVLWKLWRNCWIWYDTRG